MDEVYYEARCMILLLRVPGLNLVPLMEENELTSCLLSRPLRLRDTAQTVPHNCLLFQLDMEEATMYSNTLL